MAVDSITGNASPQIAGAIRQAAQSSGISFEYLLTTAQIESNLNPTAQAPTSTAKGLYQFIDQTWLSTIKQSGAALGLSHYADAITRDSEGHYDVPDPAARSAIMRLRSDPAASAMLAGAFTRNNAEQLTAAIGRRPSEGELYIAHFLGPDGASRLISAATTQPQASAAAMFPGAAAANRSIFYEHSGNPRSVSAVYAKLTGRFEMARAIQFAPGVSAAGIAATPLPGIPDTAGITQAFAGANPPSASNSKPLFQGMFADRDRAPVAPAITSLWVRGNTNENDAAARQDPSAHGLDLFTDGRPDARKLFGNS